MGYSLLHNRASISLVLAPQITGLRAAESFEALPINKETKLNVKCLVLFVQILDKTEPVNQWFSDICFRAGPQALLR